MQPITKLEFDFLVDKGILKCTKGRYQGLITGSNEKHGRNRSRWVEEPIYNKLLELQKELKVDKS